TPPCRRAPRARLSADTVRRETSSPRRASVFGRRRNRSSWRVTRVGDGSVGWVERSHTHQLFGLGYGFRCALPILRLVQNDYLLSRLLGVKLLHQRGTALQAGALVDVALVGEFVAVNRGRLGHEHRAR